MPIVGILIKDVIFFDRFFSMHSNTIANTPASSNDFESLIIFFF